MKDKSQENDCGVVQKGNGGTGGTLRQATLSKSFDLPHLAGFADYRKLIMIYYLGSYHFINFFYQDHFLIAITLAVQCH